MKHRRNSMLSELRGESGQTLVLVLLALAVGVLAVSGFLYYASTSLLATKAAREEMIHRYASDAGAEYGLWLLGQGGLADTLTISSSPFITTVVINGMTVTVEISSAAP